MEKYIMVRKITYFVMAMIASTAWTLSSASAMDLNGEIKTISETKRTEIKKKIESIAAKSEEKILELKEKTENKTNEMRTKACEARQTNMQTRLDNRVTAADRHKEKFDAIYKKISDFASSKSLSSSDISSLANIVDAAGLNATDEIDTLNGMTVMLDCTMPDTVALTITSYKTQIDSTKTALKDYRESIRKYGQAVKTLAESTEGV